MIIERKQLVTEVREHMRGGDGSAVLHTVPQEMLSAGTRLSSIIELEPGCSIGAHAHEKETEVFHFISGSGQVDDNGTIRDVHAGDTMVTGGGASHSVRNTGSETLRLFAIIILNPD